jgi:hypothetical protein
MSACASIRTYRCIAVNGSFGPSTEVSTFAVYRELRATNSGFINGLDRQKELEFRSSFSIWQRSKLTAMTFNNHAANR